MVEVREYLAADGASPYRRWFGRLNAEAAARVTIAVTRMSLGNLSNLKPVGGGVLEHRIDFGPGYRIYLSRDGHRLVILLGGGTKKRQQADIAAAQELWADYKRRKAQER